MLKNVYWSEYEQATHIFKPLSDGIEETSKGLKYIVPNSKSTEEISYLLDERIDVNHRTYI